MSECPCSKHPIGCYGHPHSCGCNSDTNAVEKAVKVARGDGYKHWANLSATDRDMAELGVRRVVAAGYRLVAPGELDDETLERVAEFTQNEFQRDFESPVGWRGQFVAAIRALKDSQPQTERQAE